MQTHFTEDQLRDPALAEANKILRSCVHCGFCTATCPTYQVLGDELDSPRGRIYLIKEMLETGRPADARTVKHVDRCLSCLACMTTCPSGVNYMHLVDEARAHVEETYRRPLSERLLRNVLAYTMPLALFKLAIPVLLSLLVIRLGVKVLQAAFNNTPAIRLLERSISWIAWLAMVLWVSGLLPLVMEELDQISWKVGASNLSLRNIIEGSLTAGLVLIITLWISAGLESRFVRSATGGVL